MCFRGVAAGVADVDDACSVVCCSAVGISTAGVAVEFGVSVAGAVWLGSVVFGGSSVAVFLAVGVGVADLSVGVGVTCAVVGSLVSGSAVSIGRGVSVGSGVTWVATGSSVAVGVGTAVGKSVALAIGVAVSVLATVACVASDVVCWVVVILSAAWTSPVPVVEATGVSLCSTAATGATAGVAVAAGGAAAALVCP